MFALLYPLPARINVLSAQPIATVRYAANTCSIPLVLLFLCHAVTTFTRAVTSYTWRQHTNVPCARKVPSIWSYNGESSRKQSRVNRCQSSSPILALLFSVTIALQSHPSATIGLGISATLATRTIRTNYGSSMGRKASKWPTHCLRAISNRGPDHLPVEHLPRPSH